ncbi:MAG: flagellar biosynthesis protein FlhA [Spirochaetales bacterium]|nr:flagellar biosynthesis protein FlhA [Spirochaetales bacterium]
MASIQDNLKKVIGGNVGDFALAFAIIGLIVIIVIPLPTAFLDFLMIINIAGSIVIILSVIYSRNALDFSLFPTMLLVSTIFGLALNIASTRLILTQGIKFAGQMVKAFSTVVVGTSGSEGMVVGIVIFIIIIVVQFMVITKGATRVAEVAARFSLDALPGKQMSIEAEFNSGALTEDEARKKKDDLQKEVNFYGAMDGASKFISGSVKAGLAITFINVIAGFIIGITIRGEGAAIAAETYTKLTIGDGLVSQVPTLLISFATGLMVTRSISDGTFSSDVKEQFTRTSNIYWVGAVFMLLLAFVPGFPWYLLVPLAILSGYFAFILNRGERRKEEKIRIAKEAKDNAVTKAPEEMAPVVPLDPLALELGYGLIPLVDQEHGAELLNRITKIRREAALDLGLVVPRIRIVDNMRLEPAEYSFKIRGVSVGKGIINLGQYLAINPGGDREEIPGTKTLDPTFGLPAIWINEDVRDLAERSGYTVVDSPSIIATHLTEIIRNFAHEILGRQEVKAIIDALKEEFSAVVDEVNKNYSVGEIQKVLQGLLKEQVSIRNIVSILETLSDYSGVTKDPGFLIEKVRQSLKRQICQQYISEDNILHVITIAPDFEQEIIDSAIETTSGRIAALSPDRQRAWIKSLTNVMHNVGNMGYYPVLLCSESARSIVKKSIERDISDLAVLSVHEISDKVKIESLGFVSLEEVST